MSRRYQLPGATDAVLAALAGRLDTLERHTHDHTQTLTALTRAIADLTALARTDRHFLDDSGPSQPGTATAAGPGQQLTVDEPGEGETFERAARLASTPRPSTGSTAAAASDSGKGQRDWLAVGDPAVARLWLHQADQFTRTVLAHHGFTASGALPSCWALHPGVVADLLALAGEHTAAYTGTKPTPVSEWLTRWLPAARERITTTLQACRNERAHHEAGRTWAHEDLDLDSVAIWWATDRDRPAHDAFQLTPTH